jgi:iron complex outermembrane recepter protein
VREVRRALFTFGRGAAGASPVLPAALFAALTFSRTAAGQVVQAEPATEIVADFPTGAPPVETQVALQVVVDASGGVESTVEVSRAPRDAPDAFVTAAVQAVKAARFTPSSRDGRPIRSRVEYVLVFHPPAGAIAARAGASAPAPAAPAVPEIVQVRGVAPYTPRGLGDVRVDRETLTASPRQQTSEMLSAAPGFFVDHEDGEGIGNDVYLRGFDLENGSGIEMKVGQVPINIPLHIRGQGYADVNFIIPEVVRSIRVLEGAYDPRQGDAAIVGSAIFDLGVSERGYQFKALYGSFGQSRIVGIAAPREANDETFAAFSLRETHGFGQDRASKSASVNAQYGVDLGERDHLKLLATAYGTQSVLPGVVRQDDVDAGLIGYYDSYPYFNSYYPRNCAVGDTSCAQPAQGVQAERVIVAAELDHTPGGGTLLEIAPWVMWTNFLSRENYTGNVFTSSVQLMAPTYGDLWQLTNVETAAGVTAHFHTASLHVGDFGEVVMEPGTSLRVGTTSQSKDLLNPANLDPWDYRENYGVRSLDLAGYFDVDARFWKKLHLAGGVRADFLEVSIDDNLEGVVKPIPANALPGATIDAGAVAPGPRGTIAYDFAPELTPVVSAGEGFRSLDAQALTLCNAPTVPLTGGASQPPPCKLGKPYSSVTSFEAGFRSTASSGRYVTSLTAFQSNVANELVFEVTSGGLTTEGASTRRGIVGSFLGKPTPWLLASSAVSVQTATFNTLVAGTSHYVPNIPALVWRVDVNAHGDLAKLPGGPIAARAGVGYTLLAGKHVNDVITAPPNNVLNALASIRYRFLELGVDMYNVLGLKYADDEEYYVSDWSLVAPPASNPTAQGRASGAVHITAAPPRTTLGTLTLYL